MYLSGKGAGGLGSDLKAKNIRYDLDLDYDLDLTEQERVCTEQNAFFFL